MAKFDIAHNLSEIGVQISAIKKKVLPSSVKRSLTRSIKALEVAAIQRAKRYRPLKQKEIRKEWLRIRKMLKGRTIAGYSAELWVRDKAISAIRLMSKAARKPKNQRGKKAGKNKAYRSRGKLRIMKHPGQKADSNGQFVAKGKGGNYHVFRRMKNAKSKGVGRKRSNPGLKKSAFPSLHIYFEKAKIRNGLLSFIGKRQQKEFLAAIDWFMKGVKK